MSYNELHLHPRDSRLSFEPESHTYFIDGEAFRSVTEVVDECFEQFDAEYWSKRKAGSAQAARKLREQWEEKGRLAREAGTLLHSRIENHYLGNEPDSEALQDHCFNLFKQFTRLFPLNPYRTEWQIYYEEARLAGTLDFLAEVAPDTYHIYDWKRSGKLIDSWGNLMQSNAYGKTGLHPVSHIPDTPLHHYALQLSIYRYILEKKYGMTVTDAFLGVFYPDLSKPFRIRVPYLLREVETLINLLSK